MRNYSASFLQDDLATELSKILDGMLLPDPDGNRIPINIFKQWLPVQSAQELPEGITDEALEEGSYAAKEQQDPFPFILVRLMQGTIKEPNSAQQVDIALIIGVIDRGYENQGHKDVLNIIQKIHERFAKNQILAHGYECVYPMDWFMQDEESWPYFYGSVALKFETVPIRREDPFT